MLVRKLLSVFALTTVVAVGAQAQTAARPVVFGVKAGMAIPLGSFSDGYDLGFLLGGHAQFRTAALPFILRGEIDYSRYGAKSSDDVNGRILAFTINGIKEFPSQSATKFYGIGGLGLYNVKTSVDMGESTVSNSENDFGLNAGAGLKIPLSGFDTFIEARFHWIFASGESAHVLPITFGINF